jgi:hypothetical protein
MNENKRKNVYPEFIRSMPKVLQDYAEEVLLLSKRLSPDGNEPLTEREKEILRTVTFAQVSALLSEAKFFYLSGDRQDMESNFERISWYFNALSGG